MHAQKSGTAFWYQKLTPNRAAHYSVQVSGNRKLAQESMSDTRSRNLHKFETCTSFWYCRHAGDMVLYNNKKNPEIYISKNPNPNPNP